jgi:hypothetical protein
MGVQLRFHRAGKDCLALACAALIFLLASAPLGAQAGQDASQAAPSKPAPQAAPRPPALPGQGTPSSPCWQQVGISRRSIRLWALLENDIKSEIALVCTNTSLTPAEREAKARQIRKQGDERGEKVISSDERAMLKACGAERRKESGQTSIPTTNTLCTETQPPASAHQH